MTLNDTYALLAYQQRELEQQKEALRATIQKDIDEYWVWFKAQNLKLSELRKAGEDVARPNSIAPVIEIKKSGKKIDGKHIETVYVVWKNHYAKFRDDINKSLTKKVSVSKPIHSYAVLDAMPMVMRRCTWNKTRAIELEQKLRIYRIALKGLHEASVRLRSAKRTLSNIKHDTQTHNTTEEVNHAI